MTFPRGRTSPFILTDSEAGNSVSEVQKSGTYMLAGSLTFRFRDQFTMCSWQRVLLKSTAGFPTQAGLQIACLRSSSLRLRTRNARAAAGTWQAPKIVPVSNFNGQGPARVGAY